MCYYLFLNFLNYITKETYYKLYFDKLKCLCKVMALIRFLPTDTTTPTPTIKTKIALHTYKERTSTKLLIFWKVSRTLAPILKTWLNVDSLS